MPLRQIPNWLAWNQIGSSAVSVLRLESKAEEETEVWWTELSHGKVAGEEDLKLRWRKRRKYDGQNFATGKWLEKKIWNWDGGRDGRTQKVIPNSGVLPEKLIIISARQGTLASYKTYRFITAFTTARQLYLSLARSIQSTPPTPSQSISRRSHLIASYRLLLGLPTKTVYTFLFSMPRPPLSDLITPITSGEQQAYIRSRVQKFPAWPTF